jgi:hypothetical protein
MCSTEEDLFRAVKEHRFEDADAIMASMGHKDLWCFDGPACTDFEHPLMWAATTLKDIEATRYLLRRGADPNMWDLGGELTSLHFLCWEPRLDMLCLMLDYGGNMFEPDYSGRTPMSDLIKFLKDGTGSLEEKKAIVQELVARNLITAETADTQLIFTNPT